MVAMTDTAGLVTLAWVTNTGKLRNFRNRGLQVVLFQARQTFPEGVDTVSEEVGVIGLYFIWINDNIQIELKSVSGVILQYLKSF